MVWFGLPVGALIILIGSCYFVCVGITQKKLAGVFCFACVIPVAVQSLVEFPFAYAQFLIVSFVFFGICIGSNDSCIQQHRFFVIWRKSSHLKLFASNRLVACVLFVYASLGGVVFYDYVRAEKSFFEVRFDFLKFHRVDTPTFIPPQFYTLTQLDALMRAWSIQPDPKISQQSVELLASVSAHYNFSSIHYRYLLSLALTGDSLNAVREANRLRHIYGSRFYTGVLADFEEKKAIYPALSALKLPK